MRFALAAIAVLCSCGLSSPARVDGGEDIGNTGGGVPSGGSGSGGANGGGVASGGSSGGTAGGSSGGSGGGTTTAAWPYDNAVMPLGTGGGATGPIVSISGRAGEVWAASDYGVLFRSTDGTSFSRVLTTTKTFEAVYVAPDGSVFVSAGSELGVCRSGCTMSASYTWAASPAARYVGLCGTSSSNVFAVGAISGPYQTGKLMRFTGSAWSAEVSLPIDNARACFVDPAGVVWIAGDTKVARWENGAISAEGADVSALPAGLGFLGASVFGIDGWLHVAGYYRRIMSRSPQGQWTLSYLPDDSNGLYAMAGVRADEVIAAGANGKEGTTVMRFDGSTWRAAPSLMLTELALTAWVADANTIYVGGRATGSGAPPVIERLRRR